MGDGVEHFQSLYHLGSSNRILEGSGIVIGVALALDVALLTGLPVFLPRHTADQSFQDGGLTFFYLGNHGAKIKINHRDTIFWRGSRQPLLDLPGKQRKLVFVLKKEIDQATFVNGNQTGFILRPACVVITRKRTKEFL